MGSNIPPIIRSLEAETACPAIGIIFTGASEMDKKNTNAKNEEKKREGISSSLIQKFAVELQAVRASKRKSQ